MKVSQKGMIAIIADEAIVLTPYLDSAKPPVWTLAVGVTAASGIDPRKTGRVTVEQAIAMFTDKVLPKYEAGVNRALAKYGIQATQYEFDALASFHYNTGRAERIAQVWAQSGKQAAAEKMMEFVRAGKSVSRGLQIRRQKETALFLNATYGSHAVRVYEADSKGRINWKSGKVVDVSHLLPSEPPMSLLPALSPEAEALITDADKGFMESNTDKANVVAAAGGIGSAGSLFAFIENPWVQALLIVVIAMIVAGAGYIFLSRNRKRNLARDARLHS